MLKKTVWISCMQIEYYLDYTFKLWKKVSPIHSPTAMNKLELSIKYNFLIKS